MTTYRAGVIGLGRMGSTFDDEITQGRFALSAVLSRSGLTTPHRMSN